MGWLLFVGLVGRAQAGEVHVCVRPPDVPAALAGWTYNAGGATVLGLKREDIAKAAQGGTIYVFDPAAPPESVKLLPRQWASLVCPRGVPQAVATNPPTAAGGASSASPGAGAGTKVEAPKPAEKPSGGSKDGAAGGTGKGTGAKKTWLDKLAAEAAYAGAIANLQLNENNKRADGKQYGIVGGKNADGPNHPVAQAAAGAVLIATAVIAGGGFEKKLKDALSKKGTTLVITDTGKAGEQAAEKFVQEYMNREGAQKAGERLAHIADAMNKSGAIGEYAVMKKFTDGMKAQVQAHHILEKSLMEKWNLGNPDMGPSVILTEAEHKVMTATLKEAKTAEAVSTLELWKAYQKAYAAHPDWLKAIEPYFSTGK